MPRPAPPTALPVSLTASFVQTNDITLNWTAVPGAVGYAIYRATSSTGPYTYLQTVTETTYTDYGLNPATIYYYRVTAVNGGGISANATDLVNSQQPFPASLTATGTNTAVWLAWSAATNATSYTLKRGTSSGNETNTVVTGYAGTTFTNSGLANGTTYYYVVIATGSGGASGNSPEASATADPIGNGTWTAQASGNWSTGANWSSNQIALGFGYTADFSTLNLASNLTVNLDSARTISVLKFGSGTSGFNWTLAGSNTLTLGASPEIEVLNQSATISTVIAGASGLTKTGLGALTLGGTAETFSNGLAVNAGTLTLDFTPTNSPGTNLIPAANALTLGGGTLRINGSTNVGNSQTFAWISLNSGNSVLAAAPASGTNLPTLVLGALAENVGGTVEFVGPATTNSSGIVAATATITTTTAGGGGGLGIVGGYGDGENGIFATVGLYDFASTDTSAGGAGSSPYTIIGGSQVAGFYQTAGITTTTAAYDVNPAGVNSLGNAGGPPCVRFNAPRAQAITFTASTAQNIQGFLVTPNCGANNQTLAGGSGNGIEFYRDQYAGNCYGVLWQNNPSGYLNVDCVIEPGRNSPTENLNGLVQAGPGTVVYLQANYYELSSYLNGGCSVVSADSAFGNVADASTVYLNGGTVVGNATFAMDNAGANLRPFTLLGNGGGLAAATNCALTVDGYIGSGAGTGPLVIGIPASSANGNVAGLLPGTGAGTANPTPVYATGTVILDSAGNGYSGGTVITGGATLNINCVWALGGAVYGGLTFNNGTLQYAATLLNTAVDITQDTSAGCCGLTGGAPKPVTLAGNGTIDVNGNTVVYTNSLGNSGSGSLLVKSSVTNGVLTLLGANNYTGATTVTNVTLLANNASGSATGTGNVTVQNGGVLEGAGALGGSVTLASGAVLAPGNPLGALAIGGNLTLASGSKTVIHVQHFPLTNNAVNLAGTLTAGGALVVTNTGAQALARGDTFQVFSAGNYAGAFSTISLPSLTTNLLWNTNTLMISGTISVVTLTPPTIAAAQFNGAGLTVSGSGGISDWSYVVLTTTNLANPQWKPVATNQFDGNGNFNFTNAASANSPRQFYRLEVP